MARISRGWQRWFTPLWNAHGETVNPAGTELASLQQQVASLTQQLQGLSAERNAFRQRVEAWDRLGQQFEPGSIQFDQNGMPVSLVESGVEPPASSFAANGSHPFLGLVENPSTVDQWLQAQVQSLITTQGFVSQEQVNQLVQQAIQEAYQAARSDALLWRGYDRLVAQEQYKPLEDYDSPFSKTVSTILREHGLGEPMSESAKSFATDWRYRDEKALGFASELALARMSQQQQVNQQAAQSGQQAQQAAGLAAGTAGAGTSASATDPIRQAIASGASEEAVLALMDQHYGQGR